MLLLFKMESIFFFFSNSFCKKENNKSHSQKYVDTKGNSVMNKLYVARNTSRITLISDTNDHLFIKTLPANYSWETKKNAMLIVSSM